MKKVLGLDLGTASIGWAVVNEAEKEDEKSSIHKIGVRIIQYDNFVSTSTGKESKEPVNDFKSGKGISPNAGRTQKRTARRNLQRYKLRRENLVSILKQQGFISDDTILSENGNHSTFETYRLRANAATKQVTLAEFARILLMINKKRGYKSSRKANSSDEGQLIDGMAIAKKLYDEKLTPAQFVLQQLQDGKRFIPDFYRSDLQAEFNLVWDFQKQFYPEIFTDEFRTHIEGKGLKATAAAFWGKYGFNTAENKGTRDEKRMQAYQWRADATTKQLAKEEAAYVIAEINNNLNSSSGYLGAISDRSKELYFNRQTVGQYLMDKLDANPHYSLTNQVFYRQDYLDEFNTIWECQAKYHPQLTTELKNEIRDIVIFYQRRLKSQKGLVSYCEFESRQIEVTIEGKKKKKNIGLKVCPKSSPLFQEFKIWQVLNNLQVIERATGNKRFLEQEEKERLFEEVNYKKELLKNEALKLLFVNHKELDLNFSTIEGNRTQADLFKAYQNIIEASGHGEHDFSKMSSKEMREIVEDVFIGLGYNTQILKFDASLDGKEFEHQPLYQLWHMLYSFEGDDSNTGNEKLIIRITELYGFEKEYAAMIANVTFQPDYGNLSSKAIRKILPHLKEGHIYSLACEYAGYRHSKSSLTAEELNNKLLKDHLEVLPKNSLRNPVVEKILNQMVNVVNSVIESYGKPDEIRIELARELKKSAKEREVMTTTINRSTAEHEAIRERLKKEFGLQHVSRNDIIRYKLYEELKPNGHRTLYSNTYIEPGKLFSKEFDIEHIIPQSRLFDDSFSNKTLESRSINIEKGNDTAHDFVLAKYGEDGLKNYLKNIEVLWGNDLTKRTKLKKLKMKGTEIPEGFIERDIRDTQYIAKKAKAMLEELVKEVISTSGTITDRLRNDWQLVDVMQELNWDKYDKLGMTEIIENREGHKIKRINDWTKRNDHRHHAMDALTIAFTKRSHIQYLNNLNARSDKSGSIYGIEIKELERNGNGKLKFKPPFALNEFRAAAKQHLEETLISIKAKNKVVTSNINITKTKDGTKKKLQLTPRGQLHNETVYGSILQYTTKEEKVGASFDAKTIQRVANKKIKTALFNRLIEFNNDPKKAFTGKNSLDKNPVWLDEAHSAQVPEKVKTVSTETVYTIRKEVSPDLKLDKVIDVEVRRKLRARLNEYNGEPKKAFSNLNENPIWLNQEKGIAIKRVTITGISNGEALHEKKDKEGKTIVDQNGKPIPADFVSTSNNHHVAIYRDEAGNLQENVVSLFEATARANQGLPIVDKAYKQNEGWQFLFTMKQNEYFVFPNEQNGFNPLEIDLLNPLNYQLISRNLYRVQKISNKNYVFNHHLETKAVDGDTLKNKKNLIGITHIFIQTPSRLENIAKVRINHTGQIVSVGEY